MENTTATRHEAQLALAVIGAVSEAIEALGEVPSGHLYARLAGHMSLATYEQIIAILIQAGRVTRSNHLLTWVR